MTTTVMSVCDDDIELLFADSGRTPVGHEDDDFKYGKS
jgi:hypothetical protein